MTFSADISRCPDWINEKFPKASECRRTEPPATEQQRWGIFNPEDCNEFIEKEAN